MEIIFDYQPVKLITRFTVNGILRSDLFGELGAVAGYPLQSWLWKRGPWMGLGKILQDVARNRPMEITFIGRNIDFRDFEQVVNRIEKTVLRFQPAYEESSALKLQTDEFFQYIEVHPDTSVKRAFGQLISQKSMEQFYRIETVEQYRENESRIKSGRLVLLMDAAVFRTVQKELQGLLHENFMRPPESIVVLASSPQEKIVLAEELGNTGISVAEEKDIVIGDLIEKYSIPEVVSEDDRLCAALASFLDSFSARYELAKDANRKIRLHLCQEAGKDGESDQMDLIYNKNREEIRWFEMNREEISDDLLYLGKRSQNH